MKSSSLKLLSAEEIKNLSREELDRLAVQIILSMNPQQLRAAAAWINEAAAEEEKKKAHTECDSVQAM